LTDQDKELKYSIPAESPARDILRNVQKTAELSIPILTIYLLIAMHHNPGTIGFRLQQLKNDPPLSRLINQFLAFQPPGQVSSCYRFVLQD